MAANVLKVRTVANVCGAIGLLISVLYWACMLLPKPFWPLVCQWGQPMGKFLDFKFADRALSILAVRKGHKFWIGGVVFA
jgi:hypothetical protein